MSENKPLLVTIDEAAKETGLSKWYIRQGIKNGKIPYVCCGAKYMVNLPMLTEMINDLSKANAE